MSLLISIGKRKLHTILPRMRKVDEGIGPLGRYQLKLFVIVVVDLAFGIGLIGSIILGLTRPT